MPTRSDPLPFNFERPRAGPTLRALLRADVHRQFGRAGVGAFVQLVLRDRGFRPIVTLRLYQATRGRGMGRALYPLIWLGHRWACRRAGMDLPLRTRVGPGLMIAHSWGIVVNEHARIGANVTLFHGVTLGRADRIDADGGRDSGYPVIAEDVWLGPHAVLVGGIAVGTGSRILANSVVTADVPPRTMMAGNPATAIRFDCRPDVPNRAEIPS